MNQKILNVVCVLLLVAIGFSCKKGDPGPQGESGPKGDTGAQGNAGPQGVTGTANVVYTAWFTPSVYVKDTVFNVWGFNYSQSVAAITQPILDSGVVLTFAKLLGYNTAIWPTTQVAQLPINLTYQSGSVMTDTWSALSTVGKVKIRFVNDHNYWNSISNAHQFRVIVIPGGVKSARVKQNSYAEICKAYNIPE